MLLDINKLLTLQIATAAALINIILLSSCCFSVKSLPITSKPIESTAENLAWEAWLMVPVGQQQKSRKVTPKSIFIVPHKNNQTSTCPPGEHWSQNRCIPTVTIDTDKALLNQLGFLAPITNFDYDYNYDEETDLSPGAEKLEGSADTNQFSMNESVDEPFKFSIFRDTPIGSSGSGDSSGSRDSEDENVFFIGERRRRPPTPPEMGLPDLFTDSSNNGPDNESVEDVSKASDEGTLFLSGIDAILVPAVSEDKNQKMNFSIYQETSNVTISETNDHPELDEILKHESLFFDRNYGAHQVKTTTLKTTTAERSEGKTTNALDWETTTMKLEEDEDVEGKTEFTRSVTDLPPFEEVTSQPINFEKNSPGDATSTMIPNDDIKTSTESREEDITTITSQKLDHTTIRSSTLEVSTIISSKDKTTTKLTSNEEITFPEAIITSTILPKEETTTTIASVKEDLSTIIPESSTLTNPSVDRIEEPKTSNDRSVHYELNEENAMPTVIDIVEELRKINDLVSRNNQQPTTTTTTQKPSVEAISKPNDLLSKIIFFPNNIKTSSEDPVPRSSTSTVWSSNSTSRNILSKSSSSIAVSSIEKSQESTLDPSSSTSPTPDIVEPDPYWWLPRGWGMERTEADRPLLLRFWSAISGISGSHTKV